MENETHLLSFLMMPLSCWKSGLSRGSSAQQLFIMRMTSSSQASSLMLGRSSGFSWLFTASTISAREDNKRTNKVKKRGKIYTVDLPSIKKSAVGGHVRYPPKRGETQGSHDQTLYSTYSAQTISYTLHGFTAVCFLSSSLVSLLI